MPLSYHVILIDSTGFNLTAFIAGYSAAIIEAAVIIIVRDP
jgi:hypothetical protein